MRILSTLHFYWLMDIFFKIRFWPYKIEASNALTYLLVSLFISVWYSLSVLSPAAHEPPTVHANTERLLKFNIGMVQKRYRG